MHLSALLSLAVGIASTQTGPTAMDRNVEREAGVGNCPPPIEKVVKELDSAERWVGALLLDATADGEPEVFIADTDQGGNAGEPWRVYRFTKTGDYEVLDSVFFHRLGFRIEDRELKTYWRLNASSGHFIRYHISDETILKAESTELLYSNEPEYRERMAEIIAWRGALRGASFSAKRSSAESSDDVSVICRRVE